MEYVTLHPFEIFSAVALFAILLLLVAGRKNKTILQRNTTLKDLEEKLDAQQIQSETAINNLLTKCELRTARHNASSRKAFVKLKTQHFSELSNSRTQFGNTLNRIKSNYELLTTLRELLHAKTISSLELKYQNELDGFSGIIDIDQKTASLESGYQRQKGRIELIHR